jgi:hypothetical protein
VGYFWLVSSVRQAFDSYLDGPLNWETVPQTTRDTQPLVLKKNLLRVYFYILLIHTAPFKDVIT